MNTYNIFIRFKMSCMSELGINLLDEMLDIELLFKLLIMPFIYRNLSRVYVETS